MALAISDTIAQQIAARPTHALPRNKWDKVIKNIGECAREFGRAMAFHRQYEQTCRRSADDLRVGTVEHAQLARRTFDNLRDR